MNLVVLAHLDDAIPEVFDAAQIRAQAHVRWASLLRGTTHEVASAFSSGTPHFATGAGRELPRGVGCFREQSQSFGELFNLFPVGWVHDVCAVRVAARVAAEPRSSWALNSLGAVGVGQPAALILAEDLALLALVRQSALEFGVDASLVGANDHVLVGANHPLLAASDVGLAGLVLALDWLRSAASFE